MPSQDDAIDELVRLAAGPKKAVLSRDEFFVIIHTIYVAHRERPVVPAATDGTPRVCRFPILHPCRQCASLLAIFTSHIEECCHTWLSRSCLRDPFQERAFSLSPSRLSVATGASSPADSSVLKTQSFPALGGGCRYITASMLSYLLLIFLRG